MELSTISHYNWNCHASHGLEPRFPTPPRGWGRIDRLNRSEDWKRRKEREKSIIPSRVTAKLLLSPLSSSSLLPPLQFLDGIRNASRHIIKYLNLKRALFLSEHRLSIVYLQTDGERNELTSPRMARNFIFRPQCSPSGRSPSLNTRCPIKRPRTLVYSSFAHMPILHLHTPATYRGEDS